ncbi:MAG: glycosyltransferase [Myxococcota bacterium]
MSAVDSVVTHVAAMPFPTVQGTQAAISSMMEAQHEAGREVQLLTYAFGAGPAPSYPVVRARDVPRIRSFRSGPSLGKLLLDLQLARRLRWTRGPVVAHHVEGALATLMAGRTLDVFVMHTALDSELGSYVPSLPETGQRLVSHAGGALDRVLIQCASRVAAISPMLCEKFSGLTNTEIFYLPIPWSIPDSPSAELPQEMRRALAIEEGTLVVGYVGNLDRYQGLELLIASLAKATKRRSMVLLLATASDPRAFLKEAGQEGIAIHMRIVSLAPKEIDWERRRAQIAAVMDVAVVPRRCAGGLPIKLLDALARSTPVIATRTACAGLPLDDVCTIIEDDASAPDALAEALVCFDRTRRGAFANAGRSYVASHHSSEVFLAAMDRLLDGVSVCADLRPSDQSI